MIENPDPVFARLCEAETPPLPAALRARTLAIARTNLPSRGKRPRSLLFADYMPPRALVPSLLISAAAVFVIDALRLIVRIFGIS